jgi:peptidoglycan/LPS O-acetylase OafA/YrhL
MTYSPGMLRQRDPNRPLLSPFALGLAAFVLAGVVVTIVEPDGRWWYLIWVVAASAVLVLGTLWLVPKRRADTTRERRAGAQRQH